MRKLKLFLSLLMVMLLSVGNVWAADVTTTWTATSGALGSGIGSGTFNTTVSSSSDTQEWSYARTLSSGASYTGWTSNCIQLGKKGGVENLTLSTSNIPGTIKSVAVECASYQGKHNVSITVGETEYLASTATSSWTTVGAKSGTGTSSGTITISFTGGTRALYIKSITVVYNEGGAPDPVLESIVISGTPEKDTYEAGEEFNPAGLVATGHYDNSTSADITSSVEWAYTPAGALTQGLTSVNVTATKGTVVGDKDVNITVNAALPKSSLIFTAACEGSGTANDGVEWTVESDAAESNFDSNRGVHYGTGSKAVSYIVLTSAAFSDKIKKIEVEAAGSNTPSIIVTVGGETFGETATGITNSNVKYTFEPTPAQSATEFTGVIVVRLAKESSATGALYVKSVVVTYESDGKEAADLAYATSAYLVKANGSLATPSLTNPNNLDVSYASSDEAVAEVAADGSITIKAAGKAVITASSEETDTYKAGSASYTIYVATEAGTAEDPLTEASAKSLIDLGCEMEVHVHGTVLGSQDATKFTVTLADGFQFYKLKDLGNVAFESAYIKNGDEVTAVGTLTKYNTTYELAEGCYLTAYTEYTEPLVDISNTKETAYTVAQALALATNPTSDLTKAVYITGVVYDVKSFNSTNGTLDIYIKDEGVENKFEFYKCAGIYDESLTAFTAADDVQVGDEVIGYGVMKYFSGGSIWEFDNTATGDYLVELTRPEVAVTSVAMTESTAEVEVGSTVTLHATVNPDNASDKGITWSVQSGNDYASVDENGVVTGIAAGEAVVRATSVADPTKYAECTVTVNAPAPDDRYKAEQTGFTAISGKLATVTEGTHKDKEYISYEAKQGAAATPPSIQNTDKIRLYQNGGLLVIGAAKGCKIDQVFLTTGSTYASTTIGYSKTETAIAQTGDEVAASTEWHTATGQNADTIVIVCLGTNKNSRIDVAKLDVRYTGDPAAIHHYVLAGNYVTVFNQADVFNHNGLIVYAAYDEQGEDVVDITAECSFSAPDMNQAGEQTIEITYNNAIVQSYTITINATETATLKFFAPVAWGENVYAHSWGGSDNGDHQMTAVEEGSRWFQCEIEKGVQFLFYKGNGDWSVQTKDLEAINADKCFAWTPATDDGKIVTTEITSCEMSYYIAGENLPEVTWNEGEHKAMTNNAVEFENLAAGTYKFKVTNNTWAWNLGYANADQTNSNITLVDDYGNVQFTTNDVMNVTIAYNPATEKITVNGVLPPKPFVPNISFNKNAQKINSANVTTSADKDSYGNIWNITTEGTTSFTTNAAYEQVGSSNNPASSITFTTTLTTSDEIAAISYIAIKLGGFNGTAGDVLINVDGTTYDNGALDGTSDVVIATTGADPIMGREITIEISNIDKGVKCYGIEYAYQKYELVALKFFAPRDQSHKWDNVYAYAYDPNNNYQAYVAWPGEEVTTKDAEWYVYNAPKGFNVIFHDNAGMQTNDLENVQEEACYVSTAIDYTSMKVTLEKKCIVDYYVAGDEGFTGNNWDPANPTCKFDENNQVVFHNVQAGSYQFKITNGSWAWSIGGNEFLSDELGCGTIASELGLGNTGFTIDEVQDVTITYYPATRKICLGALTVKTIGELTANNIDLYVDELKYPSFITNISDYTAADVELTFVSGDECVEFVEGQIKGTAVGTATVKVTIAETALFTGAEATFNVTVSAVPVPPTPTYTTVRENLEANRYYTICLEKNVTDANGATFWNLRYKNAEPATLVYLEEVQLPLEAGKPYIFQATAEKLEVVYGTETANDPIVNGALRGTLNGIDAEAFAALPGNPYLLINNAIRPRTTGNFLAANRAYIEYSALEVNTPQPAPGRRVRAIPMQQNTATGIDELNGSEAPAKVLINGQLFILRGEKMYDAKGQLVK